MKQNLPELIRALADHAFPTTGIMLRTIADCIDAGRGNSLEGSAYGTALDTALEALKEAARLRPVRD